jgi:hypothetical protein
MPGRMALLIESIEKRVTQLDYCAHVYRDIPDALHRVRVQQAQMKILLAELRTQAGEE